MDYSNTPQPQKFNYSTLKGIPNPLLGESEGEYKSKLISEQYKEFARKSMERSRDRSTSKRMSRHLQKREQAEKSRSPKQEVNIYATK